MPDIPSLPSAQSQFTNETGRASREFFGFLQRLMSWINEGAALQSRTVADLPDAAASTGQKYLVTDSNTAVFNATVGSGGVNIVPVVSNGTNWKVG